MKISSSWWFPFSLLTERCWLHSLEQTSKVLLSRLLKATAPFYAKLAKRVRNSSPLLLCFSYLRHPISSWLALLFFISLIFLFLFNNDMNMCVTHDSHKHFEIYELRPHISRRIIMLCWNILWKSSYILGGTECSSKTHYNLLRLFDCCIKISFEFFFFCVIEESKHLFLWLSSTGINLPDIIARQFLDCSLALNFFVSSLRQKNSFVSLPFFPRIFHTFIRAISPSLSLSDFTFTFIIFFWCLLYSKRHFLVHFSSWKSWHSLQSFIQIQDITLLMNGELFFIYTCCPALCSRSW